MDRALRNTDPDPDAEHCRRDDGDGFRTVESLRGRLLAERMASRAAKEEAERLAVKIGELEKTLTEEIEKRNRAERRLRRALEKLESLKITDLDGVGKSGCPVEDLPPASRSGASCAQDDNWCSTGSEQEPAAGAPDAADKNEDSPENRLAMVVVDTPATATAATAAVKMSDVQAVLSALGQVKQQLRLSIARKKLCSASHAAATSYHKLIA